MSAAQNMRTCPDSGAEPRGTYGNNLRLFAAIRNRKGEASSITRGKTHVWSRARSDRHKFFMSAAAVSHKFIFFTYTIF